MEPIRPAPLIAPPQRFRIAVLKVGPAFGQPKKKAVTTSLEKK